MTFQKPPTGEKNWQALFGDLARTSSRVPLVPSQDWDWRSPSVSVDPNWCARQRGRLRKRHGIPPSSRHCKCRVQGTSGNRHVQKKWSDQTLWKTTCCGMRNNIWPLFLGSFLTFHNSSPMITSFWCCSVAKCVPPPQVLGFFSLISPWLKRAKSYALMCWTDPLVVAMENLKNIYLIYNILHYTHIYIYMFSLQYEYCTWFVWRLLLIIYIYISLYIYIIYIYMH